MFQRALNVGSAGGGAQEVYHDTTTATTSAGWTTTCKLSDISIFIVWIDGTSRMIFARNNGGALEILKNTNVDVDLEVNASGYLVFKCTHSTFNTYPAEAYGYK